MMIDTMKKALLTGLGAVSLTKQKVEQVVNELVKKGELSKQQGEKIVDELLAAGKREKEAFADHVSQIVADVLKKMEVATRSDLAALEQRVAELEKELEKRE